MKRLVICALVAPFGLLSAANAAPVDHASSVVVHYADLDIHHDAGAQELLSRIDAAARKSCGSQPALGNLKMFGLWHECVKDAESSAIASIDAPNVSRLAGTALPATRTAAN